MGALRRLGERWTAQEVLRALLPGVSLGVLGGVLVLSAGGDEPDPLPPEVAAVAPPTPTPAPAAGDARLDDASPSVLAQMAAWYRVAPAPGAIPVDPQPRSADPLPAPPPATSPPPTAPPPAPVVEEILPSPTTTTPTAVVSSG